LLLLLLFVQLANESVIYVHSCAECPNIMLIERISRISTIFASASIFSHLHRKMCYLIEWDFCLPTHPSRKSIQSVISCT
jgi:hypothetical protein